MTSTPGETDTAPAAPPDAEARALARRLARVLLGTAAVVLAVLALNGVAAGAPRGAVAGTPAPEFALPLLDGPDGAMASALDLPGHATVINVWASWCPPCREEAPALRRAHEGADPERVAFLGVVRNDSPGSARDFVERFDLTYPQAVDDGSFARAYGVRGLPMTFVVDPGGRLTATHFGPISESRLAVLIEDALARADAPAPATPGAAAP
jgi:cytochrome c biogenesis protein CcmG/thiol:disulfide interchange protein DsbE